MVDYSIKPVDNQYKRNDEPKALPIHPFCVLMVAPPASGKSTLVINWLCREEFYKDAFERIVVFCPTAKCDDKYEYLLKQKILKKPSDQYRKRLGLDENEEIDDDKLKISPGDMHYDPNDFVKELTSLRKEYTEVADKHGGKKALPSTLIILDDCLGTKLIKSPALTSLIANRRHLNCSLIISTQRWCSVPKTIRININYAIIFPIFDEKEIDTIYQECGSKLGKKEFVNVVKELFEDSTERRFLCFNNNNKPSHRLIDSLKAFIVKS